jgi:cardiolipin synthase
MLNLPNFLTLIRILTIPFFLVYLSYHRYLEALIVFIFGGITDFLDGWIARWMNQQTALGAYLDPIADKLLIITSFIMLGLMDGIPEWLSIVIVSRDVLILVGYGMVYVLVEEKMYVRPTTIGKCSTTFQLLTLGVAVALLYNANILSLWVWNFLIGITAVTTVVSGLQYMYRGLVWLQNRASNITGIG